MERVRTFIGGAEVNHLFIQGVEVQAAFCNCGKFYEKESNLVFYASLLNSFTPQYAWNNDYGFTVASNQFTINDGAYLSSHKSDAILWDCPIPAGKDITINCLFKLLSNDIPRNNFGWTLKNYVPNTEFCLNANSILSEDIGLGGANFHIIGKIISELNQFVFITLTYQINPQNNYIFKVYKNGILEYLNIVKDINTVPPSGLAFPSFGKLDQTLNCCTNAHWKHFSIYNRILSDQEILILYNRGGVPQGF